MILQCLSMTAYRHAVKVPLWQIWDYFRNLCIKMRGDWQNANTVCSNYPWAIYSLFPSLQSFFSFTFRQDVCNEARCLCDNLARSRAPVTDDAVLDREGRNKCCLPGREMCCLPNKEWKQRTGSDMQEEKKNINNLHSGLSYSQKTSQNPRAGRSQFLLGGCFCPRSRHSQTRLFLAQCAADVHSDQAERRGNTHTD